MELVTNNIKEISVKYTPTMYCFGGCNISIDFDSSEEAKESLKCYKRWIIKPIQKLV